MQHCNFYVGMCFSIAVMHICRGAVLGQAGTRLLFPRQPHGAVLCTCCQSSTGITAMFWLLPSSAGTASTLQPLSQQAGRGQEEGEGHQQGTDLNWLKGYRIPYDATHSMRSWGRATTCTEALLSKGWPNTAYYWEKLRISHPWGSPRPGWMAPWASWSSGWQPCWQQWSWNQVDSEVPSNPGHSMMSRG